MIECNGYRTGSRYRRRNSDVSLVYAVERFHNGAKVLLFKNDLARVPRLEVNIIVYLAVKLACGMAIDTFLTRFQFYFGAPCRHRQFYHTGFHYNFYRLQAVVS